MRIIGIDYSKDKRKCGIAIADYENSKCNLMNIGTLSDISLEEIISEISDECLIAIDAPLGWPEELGETLIRHKAGEFIERDANCIFRRKTDEYVRQYTGKQSLDVGADKIARTAHGALDLIHTISKLLSKEIQLGWTPGVVSSIDVIEVYPAVTFMQYAIQYQGYKDKDHIEIRLKMIDKLSKYIIFTDEDRAYLSTNDHCIDAIGCILACCDYLNSDVHKPEDIEKSLKEGWIWFKDSKNVS